MARMLHKDAALRCSASDAVQSSVLRMRCGELLAASSTRASTHSSASSSSTTTASASPFPVDTSAGAHGVYRYGDDSASAVRLPRIVSTPPPSSLASSSVRHRRHSAPSETPACLREPEPLPSRRPARRHGALARYPPAAVARAPASRLPTPLSSEDRTAAILHFTVEQAARVGLSGYLSSREHCSRLDPLPPIVGVVAAAHGRRAAAMAAATPATQGSVPVVTENSGAAPERQQRRQQLSPFAAAAAAKCSAPPGVHYHPSGLQGGPPRAVRMCNRHEDVQRKVEARVTQAQVEVRAVQVTPGFAAMRDPSAVVRAQPRSPWQDREGGHRVAAQGVGLTPPLHAHPHPHPFSGGGGDLRQLLAANARGEVGVKGGWRMHDAGMAAAAAMNAATRPRSRMLPIF